MLGLCGFIVATVGDPNVDNLAIALAYSEKTTFSDLVKILRTSDMGALKNKFVLSIELKGVALRRSDLVSWYDGYNSVWQIKVAQPDMPIYVETSNGKVCTFNLPQVRS